MIDVVGASSEIHIPTQARVLNNTEAALVWLLSWSGDADYIIAAKMGTMPSKVAGILAENTHVGSKDYATKMVGSAKDTA